MGQALRADHDRGTTPGEALQVGSGERSSGQRPDWLPGVRSVEVRNDGASGGDFSGGADADGRHLVSRQSQDGVAAPVTQESTKEDIP